MKTFTTTLLASAALVIAATGTAQAALSITAIQGGAPQGVTLDNFDWLPVNPVNTTPTNGTGGLSPQSGITVTFMPTAGAALGSVSGEFAPPFLSGNNGNGFGAANGVNAAPSGNQANGANTTPYVTSGSTTSGANSDSITVLLPANGGLGYLYFGLLWGSIDDYNTLQFFDGANLVGTVFGVQVTATPDGNQGSQGTRYVNITSDTKFDRVVATSSGFAFEIDNLAFNATIPVPAPAALGLFGVGLLGLAFAARRRRPV